MADNNIPSCIESCNFPTDTLKWMKKKAAPKMAVKLMKCHKFFQYPEFPYHVATEVKTNFSNNQWHFRKLDGQEYYQEEMESIETLSKKLWILGEIYFLNSSLSAALIQKIAVCDISYLELRFQNLLIDELKVLTASGTVEKILLYNTTIKFENGELAYFGDILKCAPNVAKLEYHNDETSIIGPDFINTFKENDATKLQEIAIRMISFSSFLLFIKFMDHNPHIYYKLQFIDGSLSAEETKAVEKYVQRIIDAVGITKYPPPDISFPGQIPQQHCDLLLQIWNYTIEKLRSVKLKKFSKF